MDDAKREQKAPAGGAGDVGGIKSLFIGAGCNRIVNNVSWGPCGLVSFGAQNAVALFEPRTAQILTTLPGHKAVVNCTNWLPSSKDPPEVKNADKHYLLSGGADGIILIWHIIPRERKWGRVQKMPEAHKKGVTCITGIFTSIDSALIVSSSGDGMVLVWRIFSPADVNEDCCLSCVNHLHLGSKPVVALSLSKSPDQGETFFLAMGGIDHKIHLYYGDDAGKFVAACILKGHTDWIRGLDFSLPVYFGDRNSGVYLASSSQDKTIRIWKIIADEKEERREQSALRSFIKGPRFSSCSASYQVSLESLLIGHEDWVYSVEWHPTLLGSSLTQKDQPLSILSASMDKTMMIWRPEKTTGIWVNSVTVGELSHCALGFYGAHWGPSGDAILAHGYGGSFHLWRNVGCGHENWIPEKVPSGHFGAVSDISWAKSGEYLLSVSHDQTARIFAPCVIGASQMNWHEIARPQVHGHDINCLAIIKGEGNHQYVSGADEKVARVFEAPLSFLQSLKVLSSTGGGAEGFLSDIQILGANMSALGLSQKPIYALATRSKTTGDCIGAADSLEYVPDAAPSVLTEPPVEDQLAWHTLWPESHKLYGHGNDLVSLCCNHAGLLVASSCRAQSASFAEIWLWEVGTWRAISRLPAHSLTVTQMEFSPDDSLLLSVSRDRHFSIFSFDKSGDKVNCRLLARQEAHKRIIWSCAWNPDGAHFATGSRDKSVKLWAFVETNATLVLALPAFESGVTALAWTVPGYQHSPNGGVLAVGMESGLIELWSITGGHHDASALQGRPAVRIDPLLCHVAAVSRLRWKEVQSNKESIELASCGSDNCVRILHIGTRQVLL